MPFWTAAPIMCVTFGGSLSGERAVPLWIVVLTMYATLIMGFLVGRLGKMA